METWGNDRTKPGGRGIQGHWILTTSSQWSIRLTLGKHDEPHFLKKEKIEAQRLKMIFSKIYICCVQVVTWLCILNCPAMGVLADAP